jgi:hypothetical protein
MAQACVAMRDPKSVNDRLIACHLPITGHVISTGCSARYGPHYPQSTIDNTKSATP